MKTKFWRGVVVLALVIPLTAFAAEFRAGKQSSVQVNESITGDVYMAGASVADAGNVSGDAVVAGGNIIVSGNVGGDVLAAGGNISILSNVADDIRAAGGTLVIQGKVGGDAVVAGGQISIGGLGVGGDVVAGGGSIRIEAPVSGNLRIMGGEVYINSEITGNVDIQADKITLGSGAVINGNLTYKSGKEMVKEDGAVVRGQVSFTPRAQKEISAKWIIGLISIWLLAKFLVLLVASLIVGLTFRRYSREVVSRAVQSPLLELGRGLVTLAALPVLSIFLFFTVIGIPFGALGVLSFIALLLFAWIVAPIIIGSVVSRYFSKGEYEVSWKTILLGVFLFQIVIIVPFLGFLVQAFSILVTVGVIVAIKMQVMREWR